MYLCALQGVCDVPMCLAGGMWCTYVPCRECVVYLCALQEVCGVPMCLAGGMWCNYVLCMGYVV